MSDRECVLRFLAFYIDGWETYAENNLARYLGTVMDKINRLTSEERHMMAEDFKKAMRAGFEIFGLNAFRKSSPRRKVPRQQILV